MAKNKTAKTDSSIPDYINAIKDEKKRNDCADLIALFSRRTGFSPKMWGTSIVGFGTYHYQYESGHAGDAPLVGLAVRSHAIVLYLQCDADEREELLIQLGKHKSGKGCVYIKQLSDIDTEVLNKMIEKSIAYTTHKYPV